MRDSPDAVLEIVLLANERISAQRKEIGRLRAEVERDANTIEQCGLEICELREVLEKIAVDDPRGPGEFDCIEIARAVLDAARNEI
jgi:hypothetical protein